MAPQRDSSSSGSSRSSSPSSQRRGGRQRGRGGDSRDSDRGARRPQGDRDRRRGDSNDGGDRRRSGGGYRGRSRSQPRSSVVSQSQDNRKTRNAGFEGADRGHGGLRTFEKHDRCGGRDAGNRAREPPREAFDDFDPLEKRRPEKKDKLRRRGLKGFDREEEPGEQNASGLHPQPQPPQPQPHLQPHPQPQPQPQPPQQQQQPPPLKQPQPQSQPKLQQQPQPLDILWKKPPEVYKADPPAPAKEPQKEEDMAGALFAAAMGMDLTECLTDAGVPPQLFAALTPSKPEPQEIPEPPEPPEPAEPPQPPKPPENIAGALFAEAMGTDFAAALTSAGVTATVVEDLHASEFKTAPSPSMSSSAPVRDNITARNGKSLVDEIPVELFDSSLKHAEQLAAKLKKNRVLEEYVDEEPEVTVLKPSTCIDFAYGLCTKGPSCPGAHYERELEPGGYRPKLCQSFQSGEVCVRGSACLFAHKDSDLPPGFKSKLCMFFGRGLCRRRGCVMAHGEEELNYFAKRTADALAKTYEAAGVTPTPGGGYKTRLCMFFPHCPQNDDCRFAHGEEELKKYSGKTTMGYKTRLCTVHPRCPRGPTCTFAHGEDELKVYTAAQAQANSSKMMSGYKVRLCNLHPGCPRPLCTFAHGEEELKFYQNQFGQENENSAQTFGWGADHLAKGKGKKGKWQGEYGKGKWNSADTKVVHQQRTDATQWPETPLYDNSAPAAWRTGSGRDIALLAEQSVLDQSSGARASPMLSSGALPAAQNVMLL